MHKTQVKMSDNDFLLKKTKQKGGWGGGREKGKNKKQKNQEQQLLLKRKEMKGEEGEETELVSLRVCATGWSVY